MKRLPPQPTNTRLARLVGRMVHRFPLAFRATVDQRDRDILRLREDLGHVMMCYSDLRHDIERKMRHVAIPTAHVTAHSLEEPFQQDRAVRMTREFEPVSYAFMSSPGLYGGDDLKDITVRELRRAAEHIALRQTQKLADHIFNVTLAAYGRLPK